MERDTFRYDFGELAAGKWRGRYGLMTRRSLVQVQVAPFYLTRCGRVFKVDYDDKKSLEKPATKRFVAQLWHTKPQLSTAFFSSSSHINQQIGV